jgi:hypothetical protein
MKQEWKDVSEQRILEKIKGLEAQQIAAVLDFIEFLAEKKRRETPLVKFLNEAGGPTLRLEEVRARLAKIPGQMSDVVREERNERG